MPSTPQPLTEDAARSVLGDPSGESHWELHLDNETACWFANQVNADGSGWRGAITAVGPDGKRLSFSSNPHIHSQDAITRALQDKYFREEDLDEDALRARVRAYTQQQFP